MKKYLLLLLITAISFAQAPTKNASGFYAGSSTMNASAILQLDSTSKGMLIPRVTTTQKNAITSPATGLLVYDTTLGAFNYWAGSAWVSLSVGVQTLQQTLAAGNTYTVGDYTLTVHANEIQIINNVTGGEGLLSPEAIILSKAAGGLAFIYPDNLNAIRTHFLPDGDGTYGLTVNGVPFDVNGDATISVGTGSVTSVTGTNGVTVAMGTTTPVIGLGNITPTTVNASGTVAGSNLSGTNNGDETTATIKTKLGVAGASADGYLSQGNWNTFNGKLTGNTSITGATHTKITYDSNGLVAFGADATTADIADSTDKRYQTDAQCANNDATSSIQGQIDGKVSTTTNLTGDGVSIDLTGSGTVDLTDITPDSVIANTKITAAASMASGRQCYLYGGVVTHETGLYTVDGDKEIATSNQEVNEYHYANRLLIYNADTNSFKINGNESATQPYVDSAVAAVAADVSTNTTVIANKVDKGVDNATTVLLTTTNLNSAYPSATTGFRVYCRSIIAGAMVYEHTATANTWVGNAVIIP